MSKGKVINSVIRSVTNSNDARIIEDLIRMHSAKNKPRIVDATYCDGVMWKGCSYSPDWKIDIRDDLPGIDAVDDFAVLTSVMDSSVDVLIFDPPHLPTAAASKNSSKIWSHRYGITGDGLGREGDNVSGMFNSFLGAAKRVLSDNGVVLAKLADLTHNHCYQWQHVDFVVAAQANGLTPCDMIIKWRSTKLVSSKWVNQYHAQKVHTYWIVLRKGKCERPH